MNTKWSPDKKKHTQQQVSCCEPDCGANTRNRYFTGKRNTPDAFSVEQRYMVERRRLINRAMHGWGVVYGYLVALSSAGQPPGIVIGAGLAFDHMGQELVQTEQITVTLNAMTLVGEACEGNFYLLRVHYAERLTAEVDISDSCSCNRRQWDHVCETVYYSLENVSPPGDDRDQQPCDLACTCRNCSQRPIGKGPRAGALPCLCEHLTKLAPGADTHVDLHNGVPLAYLTLEKLNDDSNWQVSAVNDVCGPRRLVKRNDLLFDLIRGCDLTRITDISWDRWHRSDDEMSWGEFDSHFEYASGSGTNCVTKFRVAFSRPVAMKTLTPNCFSMTFLVSQSEGGWLIPQRAPIIEIQYEPEPAPNTALTKSAVLVVSRGWVQDALRSSQSVFTFLPTPVEIEIYGDYILDGNGQPVDANGNGTPGGTFHSHFTIAEKHPWTATAAIVPNNVPGGT